MPKRTDIHKILVIGSGPIQIGQACEFDYSGTQALKALKQEGFQTVLVNSNPATIMTDPEFADATYIEPLTFDFLAKIIEKEKPDALLPTVGGQTALNLAMELHQKGILKKFGVRLIGASAEAIHRAEDRKAFKECMTGIGLKVPPSGLAHSLEEARAVIREIGFPCVIRPAFTLGGAGGNIVHNPYEFEYYVQWGLSLSPIKQILIEQSVLGWKEFELEVMRDCKDNVVIICSIENMDPMGVHTGDSITVAPVQTLTDKEYQTMRDSAIKAIRAIGVDTGGCNIQFAVHPETGEQVMIEINPRVSRSSALASKATGFPIAKIAAKLAVGYALDELPNDITQKTPASFEPSIDYVVTKVPRFDFEKFPKTPDTLTTQMKSVGEVMAIGRTFRESFQKAIRSLEVRNYGPRTTDHGLRTKDLLQRPRANWSWEIAEALWMGVSIEEIYKITKIDRWFLNQIREIVNAERELKGRKLPDLSRNELWSLKADGFSDKRLALFLECSDGDVRRRRAREKIRPVYKTVDTCAAEFAAHTPYLYSTYENEDEFPPTQNKKVVILGSGPNRIGQGIEFDYACVHACMAFREAGFETIMVNCNPETVSTDYDISDRLYFEPLTLEDVLSILEKEKPDGVVLQFGGQTPLKLALGIQQAGFKILGTAGEDIDRAEDREKFKALLDELKLKQPANALAHNMEEAKAMAFQIGFPLLLRPSYVLGGRAMVVVHDAKHLEEALKEAFYVSEEHPVLIEHFLKDAVEMDVDAIGDGREIVIAGVMEHIEEAGVHSGDSSCCLPARLLGPEIIRKIEEQTIALGRALQIKGMMNVQFAVQEGVVYVLEVNPRASRTVPFVSKATGIPWAKVAVDVIASEAKQSSYHLDCFTPLRGVRNDNIYSVKTPVFPFIKFPNVDTILTTEMCSIGEVMGRGKTFAEAFAKAQLAAGQALPRPPATVFLSVHDGDKPHALSVARELSQMGYKLLTTGGTHLFLKKEGIDSERINKVLEGPPHIGEALEKGGVGLVINTTLERQQIADSYLIRRTALEKGIPYFVNIRAARAAAEAMAYLKEAGTLEPILLAKNSL
ncbi:MAG: carbamoyl-phosphate synthase large subunit [Deltaproteobacteria bacterium]|nr:carbamoyl-phosphate synthase large subunit [Deltaproteobacteria bacterium]